MCPGRVCILKSKFQRLQVPTSVLVFKFSLLFPTHVRRAFSVRPCESSALLVSPPGCHAAPCTPFPHQDTTLRGSLCFHCVQPSRVGSACFYVTASRSFHNHNVDITWSMLDAMLESIRCREDGRLPKSIPHVDARPPSVPPSHTGCLSARRLLSSTWGPKPNVNQTRLGGGREVGRRPAAEVTSCPPHL